MPSPRRPTTKPRSSSSRYRTCCDRLKLALATGACQIPEAAVRLRRGFFFVSGYMVDSRFHASAGPAQLGVLLEAWAGRIALDAAARELLISGAEELPTAGPEHVSLAAHKSYLDELRGTAAGVVIVT